MANIDRFATGLKDLAVNSLCLNPLPFVVGLASKVILSVGANEFSIVAPAKAGAQRP
jgi:hypothetical protein